MISRRLGLAAPLAVVVILTAGGAADVRGAEALAPALEWQVVSRRPHDVEAFTQGLLLDTAGRLYESTGKYGRSALREISPESGAVVRSVSLPDQLFGEGLALVGERLIQLTWRRGIAAVWDRETFELLGSFRYDGQGWGLCFDGERLVMSDGSDRLTFRDAMTFDVVGAVEVTLDGHALEELNELECVDGRVWANVWHSDTIVRIDPTDGVVDARLDLAGLLVPNPAELRRANVLNGIAYDATAETFLLTGKRWPELIEISVTQPGTDR